VAPFIAKTGFPYDCDETDSSAKRYELTASDLRVVSYIAEGMSNKEIAESDHCSEGTVKNRVSSILSKMGLQARTQIAVTAIKERLI
jgi:DNA-binding NarL/FixJ family response regulator